MIGGYPIKIGDYVVCRVNNLKGRITRAESGLAEVAWAGRGTRDWMLPQDLSAVESPQAYGWEIVCRMGPPSYEERTYLWRGLSETAARRRAALKGQGVEVLSALPITREQWIRAYGDPAIQGETRRALS